MWKVGGQVELCCDIRVFTNFCSDVHMPQKAIVESCMGSLN